MLQAPFALLRDVCSGPTAPLGHVDWEEIMCSCKHSSHASILVLNCTLSSCVGFVGKTSRSLPCVMVATLIPSVDLCLPDSSTYLRCAANRVRGLG